MESTQDKNVKVFINCIRHYFETVAAGTELAIEPPFLKGPDDRVILSYTGIIGISGDHKGAIFVSCPPSLLDDLLMRIGEPEPSVELRLDITGELANTISGNLRREFGPNFLISVPVVIRDASEVKFPKSAKNLVLPLHWNGHKGFVIISLE